MLLTTSFLRYAFRNNRNVCCVFYIFFLMSKLQIIGPTPGRTRRSCLTLNVKVEYQFTNSSEHFLETLFVKPVPSQTNRGVVEWTGVRLRVANVKTSKKRPIKNKCGVSHSEHFACVWNAVLWRNDACVSIAISKTTIVQRRNIPEKNKTQYSCFRGENARGENAFSKINRSRGTTRAVRFFYFL